MENVTFPMNRKENDLLSPYPSPPVEERGTAASVHGYRARQICFWQNLSPALFPQKRRGSKNPHVFAFPRLFAFDRLVAFHHLLAGRQCVDRIQNCCAFNRRVQV